MRAASGSVRRTADRVIAMITLPWLAPVRAIRATASRMDGSAISPSTTRIATASKVSTNPVSRPTHRPMATESIATAKPTASETRAR